MEALPVYLVHWRQPEWCAAAVTSLLASDLPVRVTVVNNSPELASGLRAALPGEVRVIETGGNLGYTGGANVGIADWLDGNAALAAVGSHDLHVEPNTFRLLSEALEHHPEFGLLGPHLVGQVAGANSLGSGSGDGVRPVEWLSGTLLVLRRECIEQIGGFDVDLCLRAGMAGWKVGLVPEARAWGLGTGDVGAGWRGRSNLVLVRRRHVGRRAALATWCSTLAEGVRGFVSSVIPGRPPGVRALSRRRARAFLGSLTSWRYVLGRVPPPQCDPRARPRP